MKMTGVEKFFVNSQWHARRRIQSAQKLFSFAKLEGKPDCLEVGCGNGAVSRASAPLYKTFPLSFDKERGIKGVR